MSGPEGKPFNIPKRLVWQAWKRVAENGGAPGVSISANPITRSGVFVRVFRRPRSGRRWLP